MKKYIFNLFSILEKITLDDFIRIGGDQGIKIKEKEIKKINKLKPNEFIFSSIGKIIRIK